MLSSALDQFPDGLELFILLCLLTFCSEVKLLLLVGVCIYLQRAIFNLIRNLGLLIFLAIQKLDGSETFNSLLLPKKRPSLFLQLLLEFLLAGLIKAHIVPSLKSPACLLVGQLGETRVV